MPFLYRIHPPRSCDLFSGPEAFSVLSQNKKKIGKDSPFIKLFIVSTVARNENVGSESCEVKVLPEVGRGVGAKSNSERY